MAALAAPLDPSQNPNTFGATGGAVDIQPPGGLSAAMPPPHLVTENDDGGITIDVSPESDEPPTPEFSANLAEHMDETELNKLAEYCLQSLDDDIASRQEWYAGLTQGMDLLGLVISDRSVPFENATGVYDTLMLEAVIRNQAQTSSELLPAAGPVKTQIIGSATEEVSERAARIAAFMNFYLLEGAPEWVENHEQMFLWRALCGSVFTKTYQDPLLNRPVSPWIGPDKLVISYYADSDLESCQRISHLVDMSFKDLRSLQVSGFYRDISLQQPDDTGTPDTVQDKVDSITGVHAPQGDTQYMFDKEFKLVEQHVDLDLDGFEHEIEDTNEETGETTAEKSRIPLPYIVTIEKTTRKILSIRRNWREDDKTHQKQSYFTHWRFIPGLGAYGLGYAHILGNPAKAATALQRQMIDAATLEMFPGGLRVKGMRMDDNNKMVGPCEFIEIDTGGLPIGQAVSPMPYKGPSQWSFELWKAGRENAQGLGNMADISVGDGRQDAPVGTTLALLEAANRMMSATVKYAHRSLKRELKLFAALFGQYLPDKPYPFPVPGGNGAIMRQDFRDDIDVIPVSDPNITSYAQRVTRAEMMVRAATQAPQIHDLREAYRNMYVEAGVDERKIEKILPPPQQAQPTDPLTENQMALTGKPIAVGAYQDHQAHIQAHQVLAEQVPTMAAHISEHLAAAMRVNVEKTLGTQLPPPGTKLPPEIENRIAVMVAQALEHLQTPEGKEPTPGQIAMAEIQVEAKKVQVKLREIEARAAETAFKEQMDNKRQVLELQNKTAIAMLQQQTAEARHREQMASKRRMN